MSETGPGLCKHPHHVLCKHLIMNEDLEQSCFGQHVCDVVTGQDLLTIFHALTPLVLKSLDMLCMLMEFWIVAKHNNFLVILACCLGSQAAVK